MTVEPASAVKVWTLITGGGTGLGLALARRFAEAGEDLILSGRDGEALEAAAESLRRPGRSVRTFPRDLSFPGAGTALAADVAAAGLEVGCLVNNAGFGIAGPFAEADPEREREMLYVNVLSLLELTRACLPGMQARGRGRILNVASTAAFQPGPWFAAYYASKAFVLSFSEALASEVGSMGVTVTALCPGATRTGFQRRAGIPDSALLRHASMDADRVAACAYRALARGEAVAVPGLANRLAVLAVRLAPRAWVRWCLGRMQMPSERSPSSPHSDRGF